MDGLVNNFLGKPAIASLRLLGFIQEVDLNTNWFKKFPILFQGLRSFGSKVRIAIQGENSAFC